MSLSPCTLTLPVLLGLAVGLNSSAGWGMLAGVVAVEDADAAAVLPRAGGPSSNAVAHTVEKKKGLFGRKTEIEITFTDDPSLPIYETLSVRGIDPVVQLGTLEELLTGRSFEDILDDPSAEDIATDGERLVLRLNDALPPALIAATTCPCISRTGAATQRILIRSSSSSIAQPRSRTACKWRRKALGSTMECGVFRSQLICSRMPPNSPSGRPASPPGRDWQSR